MANDKVKVALMYDFDKTLSPKYMQEYGMTDMVGITPSEYWTGANEYGKNINMDQIIASMYWLVKVAKDKNLTITYSDMVLSGKNIQFYDGVETWFQRINDYGSALGLEIEHYIISSGMKECIQGTTIAKEFKRIFACEYCYDENGKIRWPKQVVNYTTKTQFVYRIRKNALDNLYDGTEVNEHLEGNKICIPFSRMIYLGDGDTDIPCMKVVKENGGTSICVYEPSNEKAIINSNKIREQERVNFIAPSDYTPNSKLDLYVKKVLDKIHAEQSMLDMENM